MIVICEKVHALENLLLDIYKEKVIYTNQGTPKSYSCHPSKAHSVNKSTPNDRSQKMSTEHKHRKSNQYK